MRSAANSVDCETARRTNCLGDEEYGGHFVERLNK
jgi:hypothetical protein